MPKIERDILEIRKYINLWKGEVELSNALNYYDINRISEGLCAQLLNLVFGFELLDLNKDKANYPGIDLGDKKMSKIAFQVTSRTDKRKILHSLKIFDNNGYLADFPKGIRFLILKNRIPLKYKNEDFNDYETFFNFQTDIIFIDDFVENIKGIYYSDHNKFLEIKDFLKQEFGNSRPKEAGDVLLSTPDEKLDFHTRLFRLNHESEHHLFVPTAIGTGHVEFGLNDLTASFDERKGIIISGPSGCGKSMLAKYLASELIEHYVPVLIESKYYDSNLEESLAKELRHARFKTFEEFFYAAQQKNLKVILIVDGLNECETRLKAKFVLELITLLEKYEIKVLITTQTIENLAQFDFFEVPVTFPSLEMKVAILEKCGKGLSTTKILPILNVVKTGLEVHIIADIDSEEIDHISRFNLLEIFIKRKLEDKYLSGFVLLSAIAKLLSERIAFSAPERDVEKLLKAHNLRDDTYGKCIASGLLEESFGYVSFSHEMLFGFFVADCTVRFANRPEDILNEINAPKNFDKKLLIVVSAL